MDWFDKMVAAVGVLLLFSTAVLIAVNVVRGLVQP